MDDREKIAQLVAQLNKYAYQYYVLDEPIVADKVYDELYNQLLALEKSSSIVLADSPTRRVGGEPIKAFSRHTHISRLYSLDKCKSKAELLAWLEKIEKTIGDAEYTVEYKLDGLTACLTYEGGYLVTAATRGNGIVGEDITEQIKTIKSVPLSIDYKGKIEVKGECIMRKSAFEAYNKTASEPLKNPRNAAAGAVRNLDPKVTASRNLDIIFYDINYIADGVISSQTDGIDWLANNGFKVEKPIKTKSFDQIIEKIENTDKSKLDYDIDGMVIKVNDFALRERVGFTDKFPKWAIAYKFEAEETTTTVNDVIWQVGRTGKLTPLALVEPVELCGATIRRATLNNYADINRKNVKIGSTVFIRRSNDVIPEILATASDGTVGKEIEKPTICPECGTQLFEEGAHIFCPNSESCPPQIVASLAHFVSKDCMDIEGLSEKTLSQLHTTLGIKHSYELYDLKREDLLGLDGFKDKKADNIISAIEKSKKVTLSAFINALGVRNVGKVLAADLAKSFGSIQRLMTVQAEELVGIDDIGDIVARDIVDYFASKKFIVDGLLARGVTIKEVTASNGIFSDMRFVLTGTLDNYSRSQAAKLIEERGGSVMSTVSKDTNILVAGEKAGSKLDKAKKLGIKIVDESEFMSMLNG